MTRIREEEDWPLMGGVLHLVQQGGDWVGLQPTQAPPRCTKCNSQPISGQCTNFVFVLAVLHANMQGYQFFWKTWTGQVGILKWSGKRHGKCMKSGTSQGKLYLTTFLMRL